MGQDETLSALASDRSCRRTNFNCRLTERQNHPAGPRKLRLALCLRSISSNCWKGVPPTYPFSQETSYSCQTARLRPLRTDLFRPLYPRQPAWLSMEGISCMDSFNGQPDPSKSLAVTPPTPKANLRFDMGRCQDPTILTMLPQAPKQGAALTTQGCCFATKESFASLH